LFSRLPEVSQSIVLVDIDGTVAIRGERGPYEWDKVDEDKPNHAIVCLVRALHQAGYDIVFISGRSAICRQATFSWLAVHVLIPSKLIMREDNDFRSDEIIKLELVQDTFPDLSKILLVIDDRTKVVNMWRQTLGLTCIQVNDGDF
jgi:hypothetical protein